MKGLNQVWGWDMHVPIMTTIDRAIPRAGLTQTAPHNPLVRPEPGPAKLCAVVFLLSCMFYRLFKATENATDRDPWAEGYTNWHASVTIYN